MSPVVAYHATRRACRESIQSLGLIAQGASGRPCGVYVFRDDESFNHAGYNSRVEWYVSTMQDLWEAAYIGPLMPDIYVLNGMIFLGSVTHVMLCS